MAANSPDAYPDDLTRGAALWVPPAPESYVFGNDRVMVIPSHNLFVVDGEEQEPLPPEVFDVMTVLAKEVDRRLGWSQLAHKALPYQQNPRPSAVKLLVREARMQLKNPELTHHRPGLGAIVGYGNDVYGAASRFRTP